jgi:hypothetical protein
VKRLFAGAFVIDGKCSRNDCESSVANPQQIDVDFHMNLTRIIPELLGIVAG